MMFDFYGFGDRRLFVMLSNEGPFAVCYHRATKVMYAVSKDNHNIGTLTLLVDADGKPLIYSPEQEVQ